MVFLEGVNVDFILDGQVVYSGTTDADGNLSAYIPEGNEYDVVFSGVAAGTVEKWKPANQTFDLYRLYNSSDADLTVGNATLKAGSYIHVYPSSIQITAPLSRFVGWAPSSLFTDPAQASTYINMPASDQIIDIVPEYYILANVGNGNPLFKISSINLEVV